VTDTAIKIRARDGGEFSAYVARPAAKTAPCIVVLQEIFGVNEYIRDVADRLAEEGYIAVAPDLFWRFSPGIELGYGEADMQKAFGYYQKFDTDKAAEDIRATVDAARKLPGANGKVGAVGFCLGGKLAYLAATRAGVDAAVAYYGVGIEQNLGEAKQAKCPIAFHFGATDKFVPPEAIAKIREAFAGSGTAEFYVYPGCDHAFAAPMRPSFDKPAAMMAYSRSLGTLRRALGPHYNLSELWDKHTEYEFGTRDVDATMATMVPQPYVNHVPTMTGGVGYAELHRFYKNHFIPTTPADTRLVPISRTVGVDRVVDEMLFCFTHDIEIDWMLPGVKPTGKAVKIPLVAIICFRGDKLYHEHIYWDQASVLVQIGKLDPKNLPVAGQETAKKVVDETLPSNTLMKRWAASAPKT
jgi:carboxymethylenebutenolidase